MLQDSVDDVEVVLLSRRSPEIGEIGDRRRQTFLILDMASGGCCLGASKPF